MLSTLQTNDQYTPAGAVITISNGSVSMEGSVSFVNNEATANGGEKLPLQIRGVCRAG